LDVDLRIGGDVRGCEITALTEGIECLGDGDPGGILRGQSRLELGLAGEDIAAIIEGLNREPSSLNQLTTARLNRAFVGSARSSSATAKHACAAAITP